MKKLVLLDKLLELQSAHTRLLIEDEQREMYFNKIDAHNRELARDNDILREERAHWERKYFAISEELNRNKPEETQNDKDKEEKEA